MVHSFFYSDYFQPANFLTQDDFFKVLTGFSHFIFYPTSSEHMETRVDRTAYLSDWTPAMM